MKVIVDKLYEKNQIEEQHAHMVAVIAKKFGEKLSFSREKLNDIEKVALWHDIGKVAISEEILNKTSDLDVLEYAEIKRHPEIEYRILKASTDMNELSNYVLFHHEWWDGNGYPKKLSGNNIPIYSRIIAIAEAFVAMTSDHYYHKKNSVEAAIEELAENAGTQFDPELVALFIEHIVQFL